MSLASKLFPSRSEYILDVSTTNVTRDLKRKRAAKGSSVARKIGALALILSIGGLGAVTSFLAVNATAPKAQAFDIGVDLFCKKNDDSNPYAYLGGMSGTMDAVIQGTELAGNGSPSEQGLFPIVEPGDGVGKTAYEKYTPFAPAFDYWVGVYDGGNKDDDTKFYGTGGLANGTAVVQGPETTVKNEANSPLYSHNGGDCIALGKQFGVAFSNFIFFGPKVVIAASAELFGFAYTSSITNKDSPLYDVGQAVEQLIVGHAGTQGLKDALYLPFLTPIIMIGALSLLYVGIIKRQSTAAFQSAIWMVAAGIAGLLFVSKPLFIPEASDTVVNAVTSATTQAIISDPGANKLCAVAIPSDTTKAMNAITREVKCGMWYNAIYTPWVSGQYGVATTNNSARAQAIFNNDPRNILSKATVDVGLANNKTKITWPIYQLNNQNVNAFNTSEIAYAQLAGVDSSGTTSLGGGSGTFKPNGVWAGNDIGKPIGAAFLSSVAGLGTGLMVLVSSFSLIAYQLTMIFLVLMSPLFFLVGAAPGFGRRIAMRWLELIVGLVVKRIVVSLVLAIFIKFYSIIINIDVNWLFQMILIIALTVVGLSQRAKITSLFVDNIDFGGDKRITTEGSGKGGRLMAGLAGAAVGAVGAASGVGGGITASMVKGIVGGDATAAGAEPGNTAPTAPSSSKSAQPVAASDATPSTLPMPSSGGEPIESSAPSTPVTAPTRPGVTPPNIDVKKLNSDLRKKAIRQGAMRGAEQGFGAGKVNSQMLYNASQIGYSTGDGKYDNEVAKLEAQGRTYRDQQMLDLFGGQLEATQAQESEVERRHQEMLAATAGNNNGAIDPEVTRIIDETRRTANRIDRKVNDMKNFPGKPSSSPTASQKPIIPPKPQKPQTPGPALPPSKK